ncbi:long-chain-fatty-acid--CoA ligase [Planococcus lenghuensis]|uniref:Long-chain fatty acid--CoA ligase n=1 Tax=Planococcus lenghuensis TaxID=2213202 RepID=A0A1Q2L0W7_9BACL|nr:long-chain fatty acid--CoA ligase [Planococcus lenghuensis]AQQ54079.1 long-chain fatty acid--CoA ligase [Planococcus lenghuensis]
MERPWLAHIAEGNPKEIEIPDVSLSGLFDQSVETYANHTAITFFSKSYTYRELAERINRAAAALSKLGVKKGDRVAIMLPNCPQYPISFYGALKCGATVVQLNPMFQPAELLHILNDSGTKVLIMLDRLEPLFDAIKDRTSVEHALAVDLEKDYTEGTVADVRQVDINPAEDAAVIQYTGGTTGLPKGAVLTHRNIVANTLQSVATGEIQTKKGEERVLTISPLFHVYGMTSGMCVTFYNGGNLILVPKFDVEQVVGLIEQTKPTAFPGVPTMYIALLDYHKKKKFDLSCLASCTSGSAPLPPEVLSRFNEVSGTSVAEGYGLSEASPVTHRNPVGGVQKNGSIGIPLPNTDAKIVDVATGKQELPPGEVGELIIQGPQVMKGYWKQPEETANAIRDGWLFTGDLAKMDEDGYFYIVGRKKEMILASGFNVYPIEVENVLYRHPAVLEAAVFGVPDEYRGETVRAVAVLKEGSDVTEQELIDFCRAELAAYKVPDTVLFVDELPKTAVGKILKRTLKEQFKTV